MSEQARTYQAQVTGAPKRWCYRVCRAGRCVDYNGYDPGTGVLQEAKGLGYDKWFNRNLEPRFEFKGLKALREQAQKQARLAAGTPVRWQVAEPRMVDILKRLLKEWNVTGIEVVHTSLR